MLHKRSKFGPPCVLGWLVGIEAMLGGGLPAGGVPLGGAPLGGDPAGGVPMDGLAAPGVMLAPPPAGLVGMPVALPGGRTVVVVTVVVAAVLASGSKIGCGAPTTTTVGDGLEGSKPKQAVINHKHILIN